MTEEKFLKDICKECKRRNGKCIKNDDYIGLCVHFDKEEILDLFHCVRVRIDKRK